MIIDCRNDQEYDDALRILRVINMLRGRGPGYHPPIIEDTPWVTVRYAKPEYLIMQVSLQKVANMNIRTAAAGSVLAAGLGVAGLIGAGNASAIGASIDLNGDGTSFDIGTGATTTQSGNARNNPALAVSLFGKASTEATGNANGNVLVAVDGSVKVGGNANGNVVVNVGSKTERNGQGNKPGVTSLTVCGTQFSGQGQVIVNPLQGGVC